MSYTTTNGNGTVYYANNDRTPAQKRQLTMTFAITIAVPLFVAVITSFLA